MAAWSKYRTPLVYLNGKTVTKKELNFSFGRSEIMEDSSTHIMTTDRYEQGISFPEYLMELKND